MNRLLRISSACGIASLLLAALAVNASGQTWTSRGSAGGSGVITTGGVSSDAGPSLGNTQSQWTPRFQTPRGSFHSSSPAESSVVDEGDNLDSSDGPAPQNGYRTRVMPAVGEYSPQWQRRSRKVAYQSGMGRNGPRGGQGMPRIAQAGALGAPGQKASPFVEDEIVPQGKRMPIPDGEVQYQNEQAFDGIADGAVVDGDGYGPGCDDGCGNGCGNGGCWDGGCWNNGCFDEGYDPTSCERFFVCSPIAFLNELSFNGGVQAFKAPVDNGRNSNFGAHLGFNAGDALWHWRGIGYQVGAQYVESNFYGDQSAIGYDPNSRRQAFVTAGLFHRAFYNYGWQGGVVFDYLNDHYYYNASLYQLRAELSYLYYGGHELGAWVATQAGNSAFNSSFTFAGANQTLQTVDLYSLFYRRTFSDGTQGRVWAGFTSPINVVGGNNTNASAMVGADYRIVLSNRWDFTGVVNYLPSTQGSSSGQQAEAWAMSMNLVFYPARYARGIHNGPYRPLFNVADNTMFIVNHKR